MIGEMKKGLFRIEKFEGVYSHLSITGAGVGDQNLTCDIPVSVLAGDGSVTSSHHHTTRRETPSLKTRTRGGGLFQLPQSHPLNNDGGYTRYVR